MININYPYPMKEVLGFCGNTYSREMLPVEYNEALNLYREKMEAYSKKFRLSKSDDAYYSYLQRWFSDGPCDGGIDYNERYERHTLPIPICVYSWG